MTTSPIKPIRLSQQLDKLAAQLILAMLCGLLLVSSSFAQVKRTEQRPTPEAATMEKPPDPNETVTPSPQDSQVVDGDIIFTSPGAFGYARDIRLSDNFGGLRFYGADSLTTSPAGAAVQFFGNNANFPGQLYLDSGADNSAALIFRTAQTGGTISERMRVTANGQVGIGTTDTASGTLRVVNNGTLDGVIGVTDSLVGYAVWGIDNSSVGTDSVGVRGESSSGIGVEGQSLDGLAGRFIGDVSVSGTLTKGGGSFKIDHPLDPANRYLSHSFVESPDMMNIYNGNITTDAKGRAVVTMPDYFTALNRDFRYQLTVIGQFAQAVVFSEIKGNRFVIKTNKPSVKVSWQVTGVRQDAYAEAYRIQVEEEKQGVERGAYIHPELFNQPATKRIAGVRSPTSRKTTPTAAARRTVTKR
ncbi:MAG: hypothetical protein H0T45_15030 [Pyrinomonadaceae bacterium]|nr:hypothetical protein [Pyrinomonadaceae bacterium]